jgi:hypothetical protein
MLILRENYFSGGIMKALIFAAALCALFEAMPASADTTAMWAYDNGNCTGQLGSGLDVYVQASQVGGGQYQGTFTTGKGTISFMIPTGYTVQVTWWNHSSLILVGNGTCQQLTPACHDEGTGCLPAPVNFTIFKASNSKAFCESYANKQQALSNAAQPSCGSFSGNPRLLNCGLGNSGFWTNDYMSAYNWCLEQPNATAPNAATAQRYQAVLSCLGHYENLPAGNCDDYANWQQALSNAAQPSCGSFGNNPRLLACGFGNSGEWSNDFNAIKKTCLAQKTFSGLVSQTKDRYQKMVNCLNGYKAP